MSVILQFAVFKFSKHVGLNNGFSISVACYNSHIKPISKCEIQKYRNNSKEHAVNGSSIHFSQNGKTKFNTLVGKCCFPTAVVYTLCLRHPLINGHNK